MAIFLTGALVADIRGKLGEIVFQRTQGGPTVRSLGTWVQPNTDPQQDCRNTLYALSKAWSSTLLESERESWRSYARTNPRPNRWGHATIVNGYCAFIRHNAHAYRNTMAIQFPYAPADPPIHPPDVAITIARDTLNAELIMPPGNYPTPQEELTLYIYSGIPLNPGHNYYNNPWVLWLVVSPPDAATPGLIHVPWTWPIHASPPAYTWPQSGLGWTRAKAVAQDAETGAISTPHIITPMMIEEQTW